MRKHRLSKQGRSVRIEFAPSDEIAKYEDVSNDFMRRIFSMEPVDYAISDESAISDFRGVNDLETLEAIKQKILMEYQITVTSTYLIDIFRKIASKNI